MTESKEATEKVEETGVAQLRDSGFNIDEICDDLDNFDSKTPISSGYFSPEVGKKHLCYLVEHCRINPSKGNEGNVESEDGLVAAIKLLMHDKTVKVSAATGLVQIITEAAIPTLATSVEGSAMEVILEDKEKRGARTFFRWTVSRLKKKAAA